MDYVGSLSFSNHIVCDEGITMFSITWHFIHSDYDIKNIIVGSIAIAIGGLLSYWFIKRG